MSTDPRDFRPAGWLPGAHAQTVWGRLTRSRRLVPLRREKLATPDGDELLVDHVDGPPESPRVIVLHGLEGSSYSVYAQGLLSEIRRRGWRGIAMNFRSCARDPRDLARMLPNRRPRLYHSGETSIFWPEHSRPASPMCPCMRSVCPSEETSSSSGWAKRAPTRTSRRRSRSRRRMTSRRARDISRRGWGGCTQPVFSTRSSAR